MINDNILWFDIESTDLPIHSARIITITFILNGKERTLKINPQVPICYSASKVNGIWDKDVIDWKPFSYYAEEIYNLCCKADAYGGYNNRTFDVPLLTVELLRYGYILPVKPIFDCYEMVQSLFKSLKLKDIYTTITKKTFTAHESKADIEATVDLFYYLKDNYLN